MLRNSVIHSIFYEFLHPVLCRGFRFFCFGFLVGLGNNGSPRFILHVNLTSILDGHRSRSELPLFKFHCRLTQLWVDELEEDVG